VAVEAVHLEQLREHGGLPGLRDEGVLEAALARPRHRWAYKRRPDLATLAAAYAWGLVKNHPFLDGNKRVAFLTMVMFLGLNGYEFDAPEAEVVGRMVGAAAGRYSEQNLASWIRSRMARR
jgi:death-on-curing protein